MENHAFSPLYVARLTINGVYALNKSTIELARPILFELGPIPTATFNSLEAINQNLVASMNKNQKSSFTDEVKLLDKDRDTDIAEIKRVTTSFLKSSNPDKKQASSTLQLFLAPYWNIATVAQDIETGVIDEMLTKYKSRPDLVRAAQVLDIASLFDSLETKNRAFDTKFKSRNTEYSERTDAASNVKPAAVSAYIQFCTAIEQAMNFAPTPTIIALFNKMDELRKKYHTQEGGGDTPAANNTPEK